jgi:hypothetical protein
MSRKVREEIVVLAAALYFVGIGFIFGYMWSAI